jgi:sigma-B regulation protein RsbU (phosphoserine phosphatase)
MSEGTDGLSLFSILTQGDHSMVAQSFRRIDVLAGEVLIKEGEKGDSFFIILDGEFDVLKAAGTEEERFLHTHGPGKFFGEMSLLNPDGLRTATVRARSDGSLLALRREEFETIMENHPAAATHVMRMLSKRLKDSDDATIRDLTEKNRQLAEAYEELKAMQAKLVEQEKLEHELRLAYDIQQSILPSDLPPLCGFDFGACMQPARSVGGDFFDVIPLGNNKVGVAVGDVSDKGVPAAMFMAQFCSLLRAYARTSLTPLKTLMRVNSHLFEMNQAGMFVTALYGVLDYLTGTFQYVRAGHEVPMLVDQDGKVYMPERGVGQLLCVFEEPQLEEGQLEVPIGSTILFYTDGVTDALGRDGEFFGLQNLWKVFENGYRLNAQELCDQILESVLNYQKEQAQFDDVTLVAVHHSP